MSFVLRNPAVVEYEHLVWCPACKYGIVMWTTIAREGVVSHGCAQCNGAMQVFHRDCPVPSPVQRTLGER